MKDSLKDKVRLCHILDCINEIEAALKEKTFDIFHNDHVLRIAVVKWLEIIGEAANHVSESVKEQYKNVEWNKMVGLRHIVVHEYFGISYEIIWEAATISLKQLKNEIEIIIASIE